MKLPSGWRLGRRQGGKRVLFFQDCWAERIQDDTNLENNVRKVLKNPPARVYVPLFLSGKWNSKMKDRKGIQRLVRSGLITPEEGLSIQPSIYTWLIKNRYLSPKEKSYFEVQCTEGVHRKIGNRWYLIIDSEKLALPEKVHFNSVWECRLAYARGEVDLSKVASYSWGAVLECIGDKMQLIDVDNQQEFAKFRKSISQEVTSILNKPNPLCGYHRCGDFTQPVYYFSKMKVGENGFFNCLDKLLNLEISGYGARLLLTNGSRRKIERERHRWDRQKTVYLPFFRNRHRLGSKSLLEVRNWFQKAIHEMIVIGARSEEHKKTTFYWRGIQFGMHLLSGKIYIVDSGSKAFIPRNFLDWSESDQKAYLGEDEEAWKSVTARLKANRRLYYFLKHVVKSSKRKAWLIARHKHEQIEQEYMKKQFLKLRHLCFEVNQISNQIPIGFVEEERLLA